MNWTPFFLFGGVVHAPCFWLKSPRCHLELVRVSGCLVEVGRNLIMLEGFAQCVFQPLFDFKNEAKQWNVIVEATHSEIYDKFLSKVDAWKNPYNTSWYVKKNSNLFLTYSMISLSPFIFSPSCFNPVIFFTSPKRQLLASWAWIPRRSRSRSRRRKEPSLRLAPLKNRSLFIGKRPKLLDVLGDENMF